MTPLKLHPVDWFNLFGVFKDIFAKDKAVHMINDSEASYPDPDNLDHTEINKPTFKLLPSRQISVLKNNPFDIASGTIISPFTTLSAVRFKNDYRSAESFVMYRLMEMDIPYVRVGTDYYMIESKPTRWGSNTTLTAWKKAELAEDHTKAIMKLIPKYNGFCIEPDNINYNAIHGKYYNLYAEFPHTPYSDGPVAAADIPITMSIIRHIFSDKFDLGMRYLKLLYEHPRQILPILVLVSEERETGKTTFLNWLQMLFGENSVLIGSSSITSDFNSSYATKNLVLIDEALIEKSIGIEKLKAIATAKMMTVNPKHIQEYQVPFYGKVIMCSNKEIDFARIDPKENRFFIRKVGIVSGERNVNIESDLLKEIPKFLKYLGQLPAIDFSKSRMVFTMDELDTPELHRVKEESRSGLMKELEAKLYHFFMNNPNSDTMYASPGDIKDQWFQRDNQIHAEYIRKVLKNEFKLNTLTPIRYMPFEQGDKILGRPFLFKATDYLNKEDLSSRLLQNPGDDQF